MTANVHINCKMWCDNSVNSKYLHYRESSNKDEFCGNRLVQLYRLPSFLANRSEAEMWGVTQLEDSIRKSRFSLWTLSQSIWTWHMSLAQVATWGKNQSSLAATAVAKLLQSCPTLCNPMDSSLPGFRVLGILQARTLEWVAISFSNAWKWKVKVKSLSRVWLLATPWTAAYQAPLSMGFSRQEYWSDVPLPSPNQALEGPRFQGWLWHMSIALPWTTWGKENHWNDV